MEEDYEQIKLTIAIWKEYLKKDKNFLNIDEINYYTFKIGKGLEEQQERKFREQMEKYYISEQKKIKFLTYLDYILKNNIVKAVIQFESKKEFPMMGSINFGDYKIITVY